MSHNKWGRAGRGRRAQVRRLEEKWTEAYRERDLDVLSSLLTEDFVITVEDGNTYSKAGYIAHTADPSAQVEVAEQSDMRVHVRGSLIAVVTGVYHERGQSNHKSYECTALPRFRCESETAGACSLLITVCRRNNAFVDGSQAERNSVLLRDCVTRGCG